MPLAAVHDMAKKMNENLRIIYSIFTDFFLGHTHITKKFVSDGLWNEMGIFVRRAVAEMNAIYILSYTIAISIFPSISQIIDAYHKMMTID